MDERMALLVHPANRKSLWGKTQVFFCKVKRCRYLGYRMGNRGQGNWHARLYLKTGRLRSHCLGLADDFQPADGTSVLNFHQALERAKDWFRTQEGEAIPDIYDSDRHQPFPEVAPAPPYTVGNAVADYYAWGRIRLKAPRRIYYIAKNQILPTLGDIPLKDLTPAIVEEWLHDLAAAPSPKSAHRYFGDSAYQDYREDPEWIRRRQCTANSVFNILKAMLTRAYRHGLVDTDWAWKLVRPFKRVQKSPNVKHLSVDEISTLLGACRPDVAQVIKGGLSTGCRIGDLLRLNVADYVQDLGRVKLLTSKTNVFHHVALSKEAIEFFDLLTRDRPGEQRMFLDAEGRPWKYQRFRKKFADSQRAAGIWPLFSFNRFRHTFASHSVMAGVPLKAVADQLGHTTTRMVDEYYAHLSEDFMSERIREVMPRLFS